jgi:hypothetical protein
LLALGEASIPATAHDAKKILSFIETMKDGTAYKDKNVFVTPYDAAKHDPVYIPSFTSLL